MDQRPEAPGFLLDGFPANLTQAKLAKERMGDPVKVIVLEIPDPVMMTRFIFNDNSKDLLNILCIKQVKGRRELQ